MTLVTVENKATGSAGSSQSTVRDIITRAMRKTNIISIREIPSDNEINAILPEFNAMVQNWFNSNVIISYTQYSLSDIPSLPIGTVNPYYFDDCFVYNLSKRIIEDYNLEPRAFREIMMNARETLNIVINLKREVEFDDNKFKSSFDGTLKNTPDIDRGIYYSETSDS